MFSCMLTFAMCRGRCNKSLLRKFNILKRKRNATISKIAVPSFSSKNSASDNEIAKYCYLPCIQHQNRTAVTYGWRAATRKVRQPPFLMSQSSGKNCAYFAKNVFNQYRFLKAKGYTKSNQVLLCFCQHSFCQNDVLNFLRNRPFLSIRILIIENF